MEITAKLRFARIAPRKVRLVARALRGLPTEMADVRLRTLEPRAAVMLRKLLKSAVANAQHNFSLDPKQLRVSRVLVNEGPKLKRWMPRARGSAARILKRTSHVEIVLSGEGAGATGQGTRKTTDIETKNIEELAPEELRAAAPKTSAKDVEASRRAVKPTEAPRGVRRLLERKHGEE